MKSTISFARLNTTLLLSVMHLIGAQLSAQNCGGTAAPCTTTVSVSMSCPASIDPFGGPIALTGGSPAGGVYSGAGVANGYLDLENKSVSDLSQIVYTFTDASGCVGKDSCKYEISCDPTVSMDAKKEVCLGDTIELYVKVEGLTVHCVFESFVFASTFGSLAYFDFSIAETVDPDQVFTVRIADDLNMFRSREMGTFYPKSGNLVKIRLLARKSGDYTIDLMNFQFGGTSYPVDPITIHVADRPTVRVADSVVCANAGYRIETKASPNVTAYAWNNGSSESSITVNVSDNYIVTVRSDKGCTATDTATISFVHTGCDDKHVSTDFSADQDTRLRLEPVPASVELRISAQFTIRELSVSDHQGRRVDVPVSMHDVKATVDLSQLPQGVYQLQVFGANGEFAQESFTKL